MLCSSCTLAPRNCTGCGVPSNLYQFCCRCGNKVPEPVPCHSCKVNLPNGSLFCYKCGSNQSPEAKDAMQVEKDQVTIQNRALLLKKVPLLSNLNQDELLVLSKHMTIQVR